MMESIIDGIIAARSEAIKRGIEANAVLINDRLFYSRLLMPIGPNRGIDAPLICGLKAHYCNELPDDVLFAVAHVEKKKEQETNIESRYKRLYHLLSDPIIIAENGVLRPVKRTSRQDVYRTILRAQEILQVPGRIYPWRHKEDGVEDG